MRSLCREEERRGRVGRRRSFSSLRREDLVVVVVVDWEDIL